MISFAITNSGQTIQIACDQEGLEQLIGSLESLRDTADSIRLHTPPRGKELDERTPWGGATVPEVIIITGGDLP